MENKKLIELRNIKKEFDGTVVLDNIDLFVRDGEFLTRSAPPAAERPPFCASLPGLSLPIPARFISTARI